MNNILYILVGPPGSGKSTWAQAQKDAAWISRDKIRFSYCQNNEDYWAHEKQVIEDYFAEINHAINNKIPIVIADSTNLSKKQRRWLLTHISLQGYKVVFVYFSTSLEECLRRNALRSGRAYVPEEVIKNMFYKLEIPTQEEGEVITV